MQEDTRAIFLGNEWLTHYQLKPDDLKTLGGPEAVYKLMGLYEKQFSPAFLMTMPPYTVISLIALNEFISDGQISSDILRNIPPHEFAMELLMNSFACETANKICAHAATRLVERNNPEMCREALLIALAEKVLKA